MSLLLGVQLPVSRIGQRKLKTPEDPSVHINLSLRRFYCHVTSTVHVLSNLSFFYKVNYTTFKSILIGDREHVEQECSLAKYELKAKTAYKTSNKIWPTF